MTNGTRIEPMATAAPVDAPAALPLDEALALLTYCRAGVSPAAPLAVVLANREHATDALLAALSVTPADVAALETEAPDGEHIYWLHIFACYILARWQEPRAFAPLVTYLAADSHAASEQLGDVVTEDLPAILARTYDGGDLAPLKRLIEDNFAEIFVRDAALRSLHAMALIGKLPREDVVAYGLEIADRLRTPANEEFAELLVMSLADLGEAALLPALEPWFDSGWIDPRAMRRSDLQRRIRSPRTRVDDELLRPDVFADPLMFLPNARWFTGGREGGEGAGATDALAGMLDAADDVGYMPQEPFVRAVPKVGRNDPCPCGSGKKYKKCCLDADRA